MRLRKGKMGNMILKIDLEKTYNNISWHFLKETLIEFKFNENQVELIMCCVTSVQTSILWNGEALEEFRPLKGLRQGDPLSLYLFVLCMERLSNMISRRVEEKKWKGISFARGGPCLTHLFFANDLLLFATADTKHCATITEVMNEFSFISRLMINLQKSKMFVSPNIDLRQARDLSARCGIPLTSNLGKYLGVPLFNERVSRSHFNYILENLQTKLAGWKRSVLSLAGRATLVQSVTTALPTYTMQTLELPIRLCNDIDKINRNFLQGDTLEKKKIHLVNWNEVCKKKNYGDLGIKKARDHNLALLSKLGWKLIHSEGGLWIEVLKAKYLKSLHFLNGKKTSRASPVWRGMMNSTGILRKGAKWSIGDGTNVNLWKDW